MFFIEMRQIKNMEQDFCKYKAYTDTKDYKNKPIFNILSLGMEFLLEIRRRR